MRIDIKEETSNKNPQKLFILMMLLGILFACILFHFARFENDATYKLLNIMAVISFMATPCLFVIYNVILSFIKWIRNR